MSKTKNHNSILFLTTLGLYIGLVMVGASPQVLAQAATTRNFTISDEIEVKDDLDKKPEPDGESDVSSVVGSYFDELEDFFKDLRKLRQIDKLNLDYDKFNLSQAVYHPCNYEGHLVPLHNETTSRIDERWLIPAITDISIGFEGFSRYSDCFRTGKFEGKYSTQKADLSLAYDAGSLTVKLSFEKRSARNAGIMAGDLTRAFDLIEFDDDEPVGKALAKNTTISFENNQVFIVTRLPRGSIDQLLRS